jgi:Rab proteins geranylgeranyltransferase component A
LLCSNEYALPLSLRNTIQYAIALSPRPNISIPDAMRNIRRHVSGFGTYGPFPIIVPLHGGGGELCQAFCRSAAVKGATYILGRSIRGISREALDKPFQVEFDVSPNDELPTIHANHIIRTARPPPENCVEITRSITIFQGIFESLFPIDALHSEAALIVVPPGTVSSEQDMPIQILVHGGGIGECPPGQCNLYSKVYLSRDNVFRYL